MSMIQRVIRSHTSWKFGIFITLNDHSKSNQIAIARQWSGTCTRQLNHSSSCILSFLCFFFSFLTGAAAAASAAGAALAAGLFLGFFGFDESAEDEDEDDDDEELFACDLGAGAAAEPPSVFIFFAGGWP